MIGLPLAALLLGDPAAGAQPDWSGWQAFDYRENGFGHTQYLYDGSSRRREGGVVSAWVTYDFHYSGRNPTTHVELWEIDCSRSQSRSHGGFVLEGASSFRTREKRGGFAAIAPGSAQAALAARICGAR